jgi:hypothetical protein
VQPHNPLTIITSAFALDFREVFHGPIAAPLVLASMWFWKETAPTLGIELRAIWSVLLSAICAVSFFTFSYFLIAFILEPILPWYHFSSYGFLTPSVKYDSVILTFVVMTWLPKFSIGRMFGFILWIFFIRVFAAFVSSGLSQLADYQAHKLEFDQFALAIALMVSLSIEASTKWITVKLNPGLESQGQTSMRIIVAIVIFAFAVAGFYLLHFGQACLWLIFLLLGYPLALAITVRPESLSDQTILEMYKFGAQQMPAISQIITKLMEKRSGPPSAGSHNGESPE